MNATLTSVMAEIAAAQRSQRAQIDSVLRSIVVEPVSLTAQLSELSRNLTLSGPLAGIADAARGIAAGASDADARPSVGALFAAGSHSAMKGLVGVTDPLRNVRQAHKRLMADAAATQRAYAAGFAPKLRALTSGPGGAVSGFADLARQFQRAVDSTGVENWTRRLVANARGPLPEHATLRLALAPFPRALAGQFGPITRSLERLAADLADTIQEPDELSRDLFALYRASRQATEEASGQPTRWDAEAEAALERVCDTHFSRSSVFHHRRWDTGVGAAFRQYCSERGVTAQHGWRELIRVPLLHAVSDCGSSRKIGDPDVPFGSFTPSASDVTQTHVRRILRREVETFLLGRTSSTRPRIFLTDDGELPDVEQSVSDELEARECRRRLEHDYPEVFNLLVDYTDAESRAEKEAMASALGISYDRLRSRISEARTMVMRIVSD